MFLEVQDANILWNLKKFKGSWHSAYKCIINKIILPLPPFLIPKVVIKAGKMTKAKALVAV